ncbi:MAG: helix-turn-helix domain-containing protein [Candidatus Saganbacteria bacterium]|nr:helix-turn-helix domain-containing protein [Candidatus Saganbacteria bacterium]
MVNDLLTFRQASGLSVKEIADSLGISIPHYRLLEAQRILPSARLVNKLKNKHSFSSVEFSQLKSKKIDVNVELAQINAHFHQYVTNFKAYLSGLKDKCDQIDRTINDPAASNNWIKANEKLIFSQLNTYFQEIWELYKQLPRDQVEQHKAYYQKMLQPLIFLCSFNEYIYEKPMGYAGDFIMMDYLYEDAYVGDTTFSRLIHRYTCSVPVARANMNRRIYFRKKIKRAMQLPKDTHRVMSVASGPAVEIIDSLKHEILPEKYQFTCFDFEKSAISHIKNNLNVIENDMNKKFNLNLIQGDIRYLIRSSEQENNLGNQDLIYASGLTDYLSDRLAKRLINALFKLLAPMGTLIIVNVFANDISRAYYELIGEWQLLRRNHKQMLALADDLLNDAEVYIEEEKETKMNLFMNIKKLF